MILGTKQQRRASRIRKNIRKTGSLPRLSVYRSNQHIYAQIIDDKSAKTLVGVAEIADKTKKGNKTERARELGLTIAKLATEKKIKAVVFDKGSYAYHGRVKAVAEGAREGGLQF